MESLISISLNQIKVSWSSSEGRTLEGEENEAS